MNHGTCDNDDDDDDGGGRGGYGKGWMNRPGANGNGAANGDCGCCGCNG